MTEVDLHTALASALTGVSMSRARQLRWVVGELFEAGLHRRWADPQVRAEYLSRAAAGDLRRRTAQVSSSTTASMRVRVTCLRALLAAAGVAADVGPGSAPLPVRGFRPAHAALLVDELARYARMHRSTDITVRNAAVARVVWETGCSSGALVLITLAEVDLPAAVVPIRDRRPGVAQAGPPVPTTVSAECVQLLAQWRERRTQLVAGKRGVHALWVSAVGNHHPSGSVLPAGLPLNARGLQRAHTRAVAEVNVATGGELGRPFPLTLRELAAACPAGPATPAGPGQPVPSVDGPG